MKQTYLVKGKYASEEGGSYYLYWTVVADSLADAMNQMVSHLERDTGAMHATGPVTFEPLGPVLRSN